MSLKTRVLKIESQIKPKAIPAILYVDFMDGKEILVYNDPNRKFISREEYEALETDQAIELD